MPPRRADFGYRTAVRCFLLAAGVWASPACAAPTFSTVAQFDGISLRDQLPLLEGQLVTPPDMGGGVSTDYVMQAVNSSVAIYNRAGDQLAFQTIQQFFADAGIAGTTAADRPFNPRITYDPGSSRWFVTSALNRGTDGNPVLLAVSRTADPLDGFRAVSFSTPAGTSNRLPTLGVNADAVTIATDNFAASPAAFTISINTIPKADLLGANPSLANLTRFDGLDQTTSGFSVQAVNSRNPSNGRQAIIGADVFEFFEIARQTLSFGPGQPTLTTADQIVAEFDGFPPPGRQPGGTAYSTLGDQIISQVNQWGDFIYAVRSVSDPNFPGTGERAAVHWMIIRESTNAIVAEGVVKANDLDFSHASIAANAEGNFVIAMNGSGPAQRLSAYAIACTFNGGTVAQCGKPAIVREGLDDNYLLDVGGGNRWGSYSALQLDPTDPTGFWLFQQIPDSPDLGSPVGQTGRWGSVVTQIRVDALAVPEPGMAALFGLGLLGIAARRFRARMQ